MSTLRATNIKHESSATNQIVLGADGSIGGTLGDTLAAKATKTSGTTAPSTPATGDIWYDTNSTPPAAKFYDGSSWQSFSSGLSPLGGWATISTTPTGSYTDADGDWDYWQFSSNGTLTVTEAGFVQYLLVGGGGGGYAGATDAGGGGGGLLQGVALLDALAHPVVVGAGGATPSGTGGQSSISSPLLAVQGGGRGDNSISIGGGSGGGAPTNTYVVGQGNAGYTSGSYLGGGGAGGAATSGTGGPGLSSSITGSSVTYAAGGTAAGTDPPVANSGNGGTRSQNGSSGVVVVRRPA